MDQPLSGIVTVIVPARAELLHLVRSLVADVAERHDLDLDTVEDLRLATDEACAQLLRTGGDVLTVEVEPRPDGIEIRCTTDARVTPWPRPGSEHTLSAQILRGLTHDVRWERDDAGSPVIALARRVQGSDR